MTYARVIATGGYLPRRVLTNHDLEKTLETTHEWIVERTGITQRHLAAPDESSADMAVQCIQRAFEHAGDLRQTDLIIVATSTPDTVFPSTACHVQRQLGLAACAAFDVSAACAGFSYALSVADQFIRSGQAKQAIVVGSEAMSRVLDWDDRSTCVLFGDGAGCVVLRADTKPGVISTHLHADGRYADVLYVPNPLPGQTGTRGERPVMHMQGRDVFKLAVHAVSDVITETLEANALSARDIDWLVPHQANVRIIEGIRKKLDLSREQVAVTIDKQANTSSASIPLALDHLLQTHQVKRGDKLILVGFGGGFAWGSAYLQY